MEHAPRTAPVVLAGFCSFLNLYDTQPILPLLAGVFHASYVAVTLTITLGTFGVAIAAPMAGQAADRVGRKRVIVWSAAILGLTTLCAASAGSLDWLIFWRFLQGLATPGVFAVAVAYINDEWPAERAASAVGAYISGTIMGGFIGRVMAGFIAEYLGWRWIFILLGAMIAAIAMVLGRTLPTEKRFTRSAHGGRIIEPMLMHLRNRRLLATYVVGFGVLFVLVALFTYVTFYLAAPPFRWSPGLLGSIFCVYLAGAVVTPVAGRGIDRFGQRAAVPAASAIGVAGALLCLIPRVWAIMAGLALCSCAVFIAQSAASSYIGAVAGHSRALAVGLYVMFYYAGGSFGATGPGRLYQAYGWPGCVELVVVVYAMLGSVAWFG